MLRFENILPNTYLLKTPFNGLWSGVFLFIGKENILVDTGATAEVVDEYIVPALADMGMSSADIDWIINTHCHGDHTGGNRRMLELSSHTKLAAFEPAADKIRNPLKYGAAIRLTYPAYSPPPQKVLLGCEPDLILKEGELLGERLQLIHTPGHDSECVSLLDLETNALYTGDALQGFGMTGVSGASGLAFFQYLADYRKTLQKISALSNVEHLVASHDYVPYGHFASGKELVNKALQINDVVLDIYTTLIRRELDVGCTDTAEIATHVIQAMGTAVPEKIFMAMFSVDEIVAEITGVARQIKTT